MSGYLVFDTSELTPTLVSILNRDRGGKFFTVESILSENKYKYQIWMFESSIPINEVSKMILMYDIYYGHSNMYNDIRMFFLEKRI